MKQNTPELETCVELLFLRLTLSRFSLRAELSDAQAHTANMNWNSGFEPEKALCQAAQKAATRQNARVPNANCRKRRAARPKNRGRKSPVEFDRTCQHALSNEKHQNHAFVSL
jgi:hypothetical protein